MDRKQFLTRLTALGATVVIAPMALTSCGGSEQKSTANTQSAPAAKPEATPKSAPAAEPELGPDACQDYSGLTETDLQAREGLQYIAQSEKADQNCLNCNFYQLPEGTDGCGGCQLFKGPVHPKGWCMSWYKKMEG